MVAAAAASNLDSAFAQKVSKCWPAPLRRRIKWATYSELVNQAPLVAFVLRGGEIGRMGLAGVLPPPSELATPTPGGRRFRNLMLGILTMSLSSSSYLESLRAILVACGEGELAKVGAMKGAVATPRDELQHQEKGKEDDESLLIKAQLSKSRWKVWCCGSLRAKVVLEGLRR